MAKTPNKAPRSSRDSGSSAVPPTNSKTALNEAAAGFLIALTELTKEITQALRDERRVDQDKDSD